MTYTVLVCWSDIPDETHFVIFENISLELMNKLASFNGKYINSDEETEDLYALFYDPDGKFLHQKLPGPIIGGKWDCVILTGFIN